MISGQVKEVKIQRDVFGRLLYASIENKVDIEQALSFPLAPIAFSPRHSDGNICKTPKSVVIDELLAYQSDINVPDADIHIFDGFYLLHSLKNLPSSYGKVSEQIFKIVTFNRKETHIIFDKYHNTPSLKDYEHQLRGEEEINFDIKTENKRSAEFTKLLRSSNFKKKFVEFLIED